MNNTLHRLYVITGKGGVGKTTNALALTKYLSDSGKKAQVVYFTNSKMSLDTKRYDEVEILAQQCGVSALKLDLMESCHKYMTMKLKSSTIASWILKTPFFKSLINMIPGFSYLIYMGQLLDDLKKDPELIYVLDSPSSGHALTMFEATKNFGKIFASGILYQDTQVMLSLLQDPAFLKINILSLPTALSLAEARELESQLRELGLTNIEISGNNTLIKYGQSNLPEFLQKKINNETLALNEYTSDLSHNIPFSLAQKNSDIVKELLPSMEYLV